MRIALCTYTINSIFFPCKILLNNDHRGTSFFISSIPQKHHGRGPICNARCSTDELHRPAYPIFRGMCHLHHLVILPKYRFENALGEGRGGCKYWSVCILISNRKISFELFQISTVKQNYC